MTKYKTAREYHTEILAKEGVLGVSNPGFIGSLRRAHDRIAELDGLLASKTQSAITVPMLTAAQKYLGMNAADRGQFSSDGNALPADDFNNLPLSARISHHAAGGRVEVTALTKTVWVNSLDPLRVNKGKISHEAFSKLGFKDQAALIRLGILIAR